MFGHLNPINIFMRSREFFSRIVVLVENGGKRKDVYKIQKESTFIKRRIINN